MLSRFIPLIDDCGRKYKGKTNQKVGKLSDAHRNGSSDEQIQCDFQSFNADGCPGAKSKSSNQYDNLIEAKLIKIRRKGKGDFKHHDQKGQCSQNTDFGDGLYTHPAFC